MKTLPLSKVYQLLEPGPVVLLTTARKGRANVMTMSWHMMVEFEPPQVACVVSNANYSFAALRATGECVIAIPARKLATTVVKVGNSSARNVTDKFAAFGLTKTPAKRVVPPLVADCFANLECKVIPVAPWWILAALSRLSGSAYAERQSSGFFLSFKCLTRATKGV